VKDGQANWDIGGTLSPLSRSWIKTLTLPMVVCTRYQITLISGGPHKENYTTTSNNIADFNPYFKRGLLVLSNGVVW